MNSSTRGRALAAAGAVVATAGVAAEAHADIMLVDVEWSFYQGGLVQEDPGNFIVFQDHYHGSPARNVVAGSLAGAAFESIATMQTQLVEHAGFLSFTAVNELSVWAEVDIFTPEGEAHAFAGLSAFVITFEIFSNTYHYSGSELLEDEHGMLHSSGSVLGPGTYSYFEVNPFPPLTQTLFVGAGESDSAQSMRVLEFAFEIPAPSCAALLAMVMWPGRRRRAA